MAEIELRTVVKGGWTDISTEANRAYVFPGEMTIIIYNPQWLKMSASGAHRILDRTGVSHCIPWGWRHLYWIAKPGAAHFVL